MESMTRTLVDIFATASATRITIIYNPRRGHYCRNVGQCWLLFPCAVASRKWALQAGLVSNFMLSVLANSRPGLPLL